MAGQGTVAGIAATGAQLDLQILTELRLISMLLSQNGATVTEDLATLRAQILVSITNTTPEGP